jgi:hypothetical protein
VGGLTVDGGVYDTLLPSLDLDRDPEDPAARLEGLQLAGLRVQADQLVGASLAGLLVHGGEVDGLSVGAVTLARRSRRGVAIGLFNHARDLEGVLIGLLNHVPTNPTPFKWLPLINVGLP